jgi:hypothetical protein
MSLKLNFSGRTVNFNFYIKKLNNMKNKIKVIFLFLAGMAILNSCLKDSADYWKSDVAGKMYATVLVPTLQSMGVKPIPDTVGFSFMVNIATDALPTQDITVNMAIDPDAVVAYAARTGKNYKAFPTVSIVNPTVVIAKGTRTAIINCKVWGADKLSACDNFIAAISIDNVSGGIPIATNMKTCLMSLPISNPYAGDYQCVGYRIRPGNATEPITALETLSTVNCKTVTKNGFGNYSAYDINIEVTTDVIVVNGVNCLKVIATPMDPTTSSVVGGMWSTWTGDAATAPAPPSNGLFINYYNPVTKQFVLNCYYNSSAGNRIMYEVLTRQ